MKKVLFINPINYGRLGNFRPPFGLLIIASIFYKNGIETVWLDADILRDKHKIESKIKENLDADLILTGGLHVAYKHIKELFLYFKENNITIPTMIGGRVASTLDYLIWNKIPNAFMICKQEGEYVAESICENFPNIEKILGIEYKNSAGKIIRNKPATNIKSLDELPEIRWDFLDKDIYFNSSTFYFLSSRGCPFSCHFCRHTDSRESFRIMSPDRIISEITQIMKDYDPKEIYFTDEYFFLNKKRVNEFCDKIKNLNIKWRCTSRADNIKEKDYPLLEKMKDAGCYRIHVGIESGSQKILDKMNKKYKVKDIEEMVRTVRRAGLSVNSSFMFGYPGETKETALESMEWRIKWGFRGNYFYTTPYPGTKLYDYFKDRFQLTLDDEEKWILSCPPIKKLIFNLTDMNMEELRKLDEECRKKIEIKAKRIRRFYGRLIEKYFILKLFHKIYKRFNPNNYG